ncbi:MAG: hypothetical protein DWQ31_13995 [Planctomycetota bacterium]|nr:MAG: hypothetical protein DWQ31_13995 [Planctomycetota bacterium]
MRVGGVSWFGVLIVAMLIGCSSDSQIRAGSSRRMTIRDRYAAAIRRHVEEARIIRDGFIEEYNGAPNPNDRSNAVAKAREGLSRLDSSDCPEPYRFAFDRFRQSLVDYLPYLVLEVAPWNQVTFREPEGPSEPGGYRSTKYVGEIEAEIENRSEKIERMRRQMQNDYEALEEVAKWYDETVANINPFVGTLRRRQLKQAPAAVTQ